MRATDIGSGACWLQVHGPTDKSARGEFLPDRVERCAPTVLKDRGADKVKVVAAATVDAVATVDEVAAEDAARKRNVTKPRSKRYRTTTVSFAVEEELEAARGHHRWTQVWQSAARTRRTSATRPTGIFDGERRCSRDCVRAEARQW